jgi:hypothetical protein
MPIIQTLPAWPSDIPQPTPQLRILLALDQPEARQGLTRDQIKEAVGFSPKSGTLSPALYGIREGSSSGPAEPGLLKLGMVQYEWRRLDGVRKKVYWITQLGESGLAAYQSQFGSLPPLRDKDTCANRRYKSH